MGIAPLDAEATAEALHYGLTMPQRERQARSRVVKALLLQVTATTWLEAQLTELERGTWQGAAVHQEPGDARIIPHPELAEVAQMRG